jgi:thioredoxin reductase
MNYRVDVIVVGDSKNGHAILDKLASSRPTLHAAFISKSFKDTTKHDYTNVKYFKNEVEYVSYRQRLFCCFLKNGDNIFGTHLVVATGLNYEPLVINNKQVPCVFNSTEDVAKTAKDLPALVICNQEADAKLALDAAKKYKQVYLCTRAVDLAESLSATTMNKLAKTENIAILPNTSVQKVISNEGSLQKVELDNYSEVSCNAIYTNTPGKPAIEFLPKKILQKEEGYPVATENCESTLVPGCFVVGSSLKKYTKAMEQKVIDTILNAF